MPQPSPSSRGMPWILINQGYTICFLLVQDWYAQLCAKSYANPKSYGHLSKFNHQDRSVSSSSTKICSGVLRGTTMHFICPMRASTCMRSMSHRQEIGAFPNWNTFVRLSTDVTMIMHWWWYDVLMSRLVSGGVSRWCLGGCLASVWGMWWSWLVLWMWLIRI